MIQLNRKAEKDGFVEIIIENESRKNVWFDDLLITISVGKDIGPASSIGPITNYPDPAPTPETDNLYHVYIRSFAPPGAFGNTFEDDHRGFSLDLGYSTTSRIKQDYLIIPDGENPALSSNGPTSDPTRYGGAELIGTPSGYANIVSHSRSGGYNRVRVDTHYEGSNPFFMNAAPNIVVETRMTITENLYKTKLVLALTLNSKKFPAVEIFIEDKNGTIVAIANEGAYGNPGSLSTRSANYSTIAADITINIAPDGTFQSVYNTGSSSQVYNLIDWNGIFLARPAGPF